MRNYSQILRMPLRIFWVSSVGFISGLVSEGLGDIFSWICFIYVLSFALRKLFQKSV